MKFLRLILAAGLAAACLAPFTRPAAAQSNLLLNGGFETASGSTGSGTENWLPWWSEIAKPADGSFNYAFKPNWNQESLSNGAAGAFIYANNSAQRIVNNWDPWWAGVKQVVSAPAGSTVRLTVYARAWASANNWPSASDPTMPVRVQVGLDPNGTDNQFAGNVVWSGTLAPYDAWQAVSVQASVGAGGKVGAFLSADYRGGSRQFMTVVFDEASLTVVSSGSGAAPTSAPSGGSSSPAATARPAATAVPFALPTPGADGNIVYVVQSGDSAWSIAANVGITLQKLSELNGGINLNFISVGQRLVIGQGQPSAPPTATAAPAPTTDPNAAATAAAAPPTAAPTEAATTAPTATAAPATGSLCARIYEDKNGNALRDDGELSVAGGSLTLIDATTGAPVQAYTTQAGEEEHCFTAILPGVYNLAAAPPAGYNATTSASARLEVQPSASVNIEFGAQKSSNATQTAAGAAADNPNLRVALFGAAGIMLILLAAGIAGFLMLRRR